MATHATRTKNHLSSTRAHDPRTLAQHEARLERALETQRKALETLAKVLVVHGVSKAPPFARFGVPSTREILSQGPAAAADWSIALVHAVFREERLPAAVTPAVKKVGNSARSLKRALAQVSSNAPAPVKRAA